tara:strand:- start:123 stop:920 length:798 start_codon:yes stop_codon:yes gene_type:complete
MKIDKKLRYTPGVYKITNTINNKCYIGSSIDIYNRGSTYRHLIKRNKLHNKHLQSSVNKYGYEAFTFEALEKCDKDISVKDLHDIEQSYIDKIKPEYNKRHIVDTNHLLSHSQETKDKISKSLKEAFIKGTKVVNRVQEHNIKVSLFDLNGNHIQDFPGLAHCAEFLNVNYNSISYAIKSKRRRIKNYHVLKTIEKHLIIDFLKIPKVISYSKKVKILNIISNETIEFQTVKSAAKFIECKNDTLHKYYKENKIWKKKYKIISLH